MSLIFASLGRRHPLELVLGEAELGQHLGMQTLRRRHVGVGEKLLRCRFGSLGAQAR